MSTHRLDAHLQRRIGEVIDIQGDKSDAIQYYFDVRNLIEFNIYNNKKTLKAFRHNPCDIKTLEWLAQYYIETQYPEKAVEFCAQAALVK